LHLFADNSAVIETLISLTTLEKGPLVVKLPRTPGRKDSEYMHLFSGPVDEAVAQFRDSGSASAETKSKSKVSDLEARVQVLEDELAELKKQLGYENQG
jgi:uncharacterized protein YceH (UPF0502 family)